MEAGTVEAGQPVCQAGGRTEERRERGNSQVSQDL